MLYKNEKGFTLIELMVVVAIIGILAAIAVPQFAQYRRNSYNSAAESDVRNARTSQEALMQDWRFYGHSEAAVLPGAGGVGAGAALLGPTSPGNPTILTLTDASNTNRGITTPVSSLVTLFAHNDATSLSYTMGGKHFNGQMIYGVDSDSTAMYKDPSALGTAATVGAANIPASLPNVDDISGVGTWVAD